MTPEMIAYQKYMSAQGGRGIALSTSSPAPQAASTTPVSQGKGALVSNLPSLLAAGASFIPGIGAPVAAILGGAGEFGRQKLSGENTNLQKIGQEAALSAVPFGLGKAARVTKAAATAAKGAKVGKTLVSDVKTGYKAASAANAAKAEAKVAAKGGGSVFDRFAAKQRGEVVNPKVPASPFGADEEARLVQAARREGLKGSSEAQYKQLGTKFRQLDTGIKSNLANDLAVVPKSEVLGGVDARLERMVNFNPQNSAYVSAKNKFDARLAKTMTESSTTTDLYKARQELGKDLSRGFSRLQKGTVPLTAEEEVGMEYWKAMGDVLSQKNPTVKEFISRQHDLFDLSAGLKAKSMEKTTIPFTFGFRSKNLAHASQAARDKAAGAAETLAGDVPAATNAAGEVARSGNIMSKIVPYSKALIGQELTRGAAGVAGMGGSPEQPLIDTTVTDPLMTPDTSQALPTAAGDTTGADSGITDAELLQMQRKALSNPDAKTQAAQLDLITKLIDQRDKLKTSTGGTAKVAATARKEANNAKSALRSLDDIESILATDKSMPLKGAVGNLGGSVGRNLTGSAEYETAVVNAIDALIRLRTGAAATAQEVKRLRTQLPQAGDSPDVQEYKIARFRQSMVDAVNAVNAGGSSDTVDALQATL